MATNDDNKNDGTAFVPNTQPRGPTVARHVRHFPVMPPKIRAILRNDWTTLDDGTIDTVKEAAASTLMADLERLLPSANEFAHARGTFRSHLQGTFGILSAWGQPAAVQRAGLVHTAYGGDLFEFKLLESGINGADACGQRQALAHVIGGEAETLVYAFGHLDRGSICRFGEVVARTREHAVPIAGPQTIWHRGAGAEIPVSPEQQAEILIITVADYLDQMVETNGWKDHHQVDHPSNLYPGSGKPGIGLHWMSSSCRAIREYLRVIPPVFDNCTTVISLRDEMQARDDYWTVTIHEDDLSWETKVDLLKSAARLNPYVGEPYVLLAQLYYSHHRYQQAADAAHAALMRFYVLASAWDKRREFAQWVGFARITLVRSLRQVQGARTSLPKSEHDERRTSIPELVALMESMECDEEDGRDENHKLFDEEKKED